MNQTLYEKLIELAKSKSFNGHILIMCQDKKYEFVQGFENVDMHTYISSSTIFPIASGTKFLTALAIGKLIDQGRLSLETNLDEIIELPMQLRKKEVKIKHLLSHTSGLPDYLDESSSEPVTIDNMNLKSVGDYMSYLADQPLISIPGNEFKYHNGAFVYLALIIEKITDMSYQAYINNELLAPLGIMHSGIYNASEVSNHKAMGYLDINLNKTHIGFIPEASGGDGGAYFNAYDFKTLVDCFFDYSILSESLTKAFLLPQIMVDQSKDLYYGYGLWLVKHQREYIPHVIGVDAGAMFKSHFRESQDAFYLIASNTSDDIWDMISLFDLLTI